MTKTEATNGLFRSFWMGGFECSSHITRSGGRLDMSAAVQHDVEVRQDYALLRSVGMQTARDGLRWNLIDRHAGAKYNFSSFAPMLEAALSHEVQVIWDLCHYGYPDDLDIFETAFVDRFARYCRAVARFIADRTNEVPFYTPVNEISFFAWAACRPVIYPFAEGRAWDIKRQLIRAAIAGVEAIRDVDPRARFVYPEPILHAFAPEGREDLQHAADAETEAQFEAWDMIAGYLAPELGGSPEYLDILGCNYYYRNQWEEHPNERVFLRWCEHDRDPRWIPLWRLLAARYERYGRPLFIAETGHFGAGRAEWLRGITQDACAAIQAGVPLEGVCLYPILDRYDWDDPGHWHNCGLWDLEPDGEGRLRRVLNPAYAAELRRAQELTAHCQGALTHAGRS